MGFSLALGGGGAKGLAHIGVLKVLEELNVSPETISGSSIGSVIGALYASGKTAKDIEIIAENITKRSIVSFTDFTFNNKGLIKGKKIVDWLEQQIGNKTFDELDIPLKVAVTNLTKGNVEFIESGSVINAVRASIAIPGIFEPVIINDDLYVDGGVLDQVPYDHLSGVVIAVDVTAKAEVPKKITAYENLIYSFYVMRKHLDKDKRKPDILLELSLPEIGIFDFHKYSEVRRSIRKDMNEFRRQLEKIIN